MREANRPDAYGAAVALLAGGHRLAAALFGLPFGALAPGGPADLVVCDYDPPTELHADNLAGHLLFGLDRSHVSSVLVAGRFVLRERRLANVDERAGPRARAPRREGSLAANAGAAVRRYRWPTRGRSGSSRWTAEASAASCPRSCCGELEARTGRATADLFDLIVGTSTGGILALALGAPRAGARFTPADLVKLYETQGSRIFAPWPRSEGSRVVEDLLERALHIDSGGEPGLAAAVDARDPPSEVHGRRDRGGAAGGAGDGRAGQRDQHARRGHRLRPRRAAAPAVPELGGGRHAVGQLPDLAGRARDERRARVLPAGRADEPRRLRPPCTAWTAACA